MKVKKAWNDRNICTKYIIELEDGTLWMLPVTPIQAAQVESLTPYKGHHPEKLNAEELFSGLYRFYGLEKI